MLGSRLHDRMGISGWYSGISGEVKDLTSTVGIDVGDIWGMELYYNYQITPWVHATANLQFLQNTNPDNDMAIVPGIRLVIDF